MTENRGKVKKTASVPQLSAALIGPYLSQRGCSHHFPVRRLNLSPDILVIIKHVLRGKKEAHRAFVSVKSSTNAQSESRGFIACAQNTIIRKREQRGPTVAPLVHLLLIS